MHLAKLFWIYRGMFVLGYRPTREFYAITGNEQQILTNARHSWPLSSEGSLAYHTYSVYFVYFSTRKWKLSKKRHCSTVV